MYIILAACGNKQVNMAKVAYVYEFGFVTL